MGTHVCMCAEKLETHSSSFFHLTYRVKASQSDPELANMASLPRHSVPEFGLHLLKLELQLGHHAHLPWCGLWRSNLWSYCLHDKCFTHWANTPPLLPRPPSWFLKCLKPLDTDNGVIWGIVWTGLDQFYASRFNLPNEAYTLCGAVCQMGIWQ